MSETLAYSYGKQENVSVRVARIFNTYGPRMHSNDGRVVSNFILQALTGQDITVSGSFYNVAGLSVTSVGVCFLDHCSKPSLSISCS